MTRALLPVLAILWFGTVAGVTYRAFTASARPVGITIQRRALPVPVPVAAPSRPIAAPEEPDPLPTAVVEDPPAEEPPAVDEPETGTDLPAMPLVPPGSYEVAPAASAPPRLPVPDGAGDVTPAGGEATVAGWLPGGDRPIPTPVAPPRARQATRVRNATPPPDVGLPDEPKGVCLACGASAESWVQQDGIRRGYCRKHLGKPSRVRPPRAQPPPLVAESDTGETTEGEPSAASGAAETGSRQCGGMTRSGAPCRRKTRDPSGRCYQHRGR